MPEAKGDHLYHLDAITEGILKAKSRQELTEQTTGLTPPEKREAGLQVMRTGSAHGDTSAHLFLIADTLGVINEQEVDKIIIKSFVAELKNIIEESKDVQAKIEECLSELTKVNFDRAQRFINDSEVDNLLRRLEL